MKKYSIGILIAVVVLLIVLCITSDVQAEYKRFNFYSEKIEGWNADVGVFEDLQTGTVCYFILLYGKGGTGLDCIEK